MALARTRRFRSKRKVGRRFGRRMARRVSRRVPYSLTRKYDNHSFKRHYISYGWQLSMVGTPAVYGSVQTSLTQLEIYDSIRGSATPSYFQMADVTEFTNLFDRYRIAGYKLTFIPTWNNADVTAGTARLPTFHYTYDIDSAQIPSNFNDIVERTNVKSFQITKPFSMYVRNPGVDISAYGGVSSGYAVVKRSPWLDCSNANILHYGFKWAILGYTGTPINFDLKITWYLRFKNVR